MGYLRLRFHPKHQMEEGMGRRWLGYLTKDPALFGTLGQAVLLLRVYFLASYRIKRTRSLLLSLGGKDLG
jgi:uncharacterized membrane protein YdfJ with MMPL/SSD domain